MPNLWSGLMSFWVSLETCPFVTINSNNFFDSCVVSVYDSTRVLRGRVSGVSEEMFSRYVQ